MATNTDGWNMFSKEDKARVNKARVIGTGKDAIYLEDGELLGLLCIILQELWL